MASPFFHWWVMVVVTINVKTLCLQDRNQPCQHFKNWPVVLLVHSFGSKEAITVAVNFRRGKKKKSLGGIHKAFPFDSCLRGAEM